MILDFSVVRDGSFYKKIKVIKKDNPFKENTKEYWLIEFLLSLD